MRLINAGVGELSDRLSILALKILHGQQSGRETKHWRHEQAAILTQLHARTLNGSWFGSYTELAATNAAIWQQEDALRQLRREKDTGSSEPAVSFMEIAIYLQELNDRRAQLIEDINKAAGDHIGPEKLT